MKQEVKISADSAAAILLVNSALGLILDDAGGSMKTKDLEEQAKEAGYSYRTTRRAKDDLKKNGDIKYFQTGSAKEKTWYIEKVKFSETPEDFTGPFDS